MGAATGRGGDQRQEVGGLGPKYKRPDRQQFTLPTGGLTPPRSTIPTGAERTRPGGRGRLGTMQAADEFQGFVVPLKRIVVLARGGALEVQAAMHQAYTVVAIEFSETIDTGFKLADFQTCAQTLTSLCMFGGPLADP